MELRLYVMSAERADSELHQSVNQGFVRFYGF